MDDIDRLVADLTRWAGDSRADDDARSRAEEAWLRRQADEESRFTGLVLDLAEQGASVTVRTTSGRQHHGVVRAVADDFLVLEAGGGRAVFVPYRAVAVVRSTSTAEGSLRVPPLGTRLAHALAGIAADRPRVLVVVDSGETTSGELRTVGRDLLTLRLDGAAVAHVRLDAVAEVTLLG